MNELTKEEVYTVKEVADILGVDRSTVTKWVREYFPDKMQNGKTTYLNQEEITIIKQKMKTNSHLGRASEVTTDLEKEIIIAKALKFQQEKIAQLTLKAEKAERRVLQLIHAGKTYTTTEIAKELNLKSAQELNDILAEEEVQYKRNSTWVLYAKYSNENYESIKQQELDNGKIIYNRHWTGKGRQFILDLLNKDNLE